MISGMAIVGWVSAMKYTVDVQIFLHERSKVQLLSAYVMKNIGHKYIAKLQGTFAHFLQNWDRGGRGGAAVFRLSHRDKIWASFIVGSCLQVDPIPPSFNSFSSSPSSHYQNQRCFCKVGIAGINSNSTLYTIVLSFLLWLCKFIVEWSIFP